MNNLQFSYKGVLGGVYTKTKSFVYLLLFSVVLLGSMGLFSQTSYAQSSAGVSLQPIMFEEKVEPGETYTMKLNVTNKNTTKQTYYFVAKDISGVNEQNAPIFAPEGEITGLELSSWIVLPSESLTIGGGETKAITFDVAVPIDATPGGHFASVFVSLAPVRPELSGTGVGFQVGAIVSLQVAGDIFEEVQIREFVTDRTLYGKPEVTFRINVDNIGNVLIRPFGPLEITDMFGKKVIMETIIVNDKGSGVFPNTKRDFEAVWEDTGFRIGRYQAMVSLTYGLTDKRTVSSILTFWVLPMNVVGPILGVLLVLILAIYFGIKLTIKRKMDALHGGAGTTRRAVPQNNRTSRLTLVSIVLLVFTILFLLVLFIMFA